MQAQENEPCNRQHQEFERGISTLDTIADNGIEFQRTISRHHNGMVQIGIKGNITRTLMTPMPSLHATVVSWGQERAEEQETLRCQVHGAEPFADQEQQRDQSNEEINTIKNIMAMIRDSVKHNSWRYSNDDGKNKGECNTMIHSNHETCITSTSGGRRRSSAR